MTQKPGPASKPIFSRIPLLLASFAVCCAGCEVRYPDRELVAAQLSNPGHGHRVDRLLSHKRMQDDHTLILMAFSGGGTRAAAFSYGVLCALSQTAVTVHGKGKSLLDLVDVISSTSGGSFTAAYYGLFKDRIFRDFREKLLLKNIQGALGANLLWPPYTFRVFNPWNDFSRIDMAAELYARLLFGGNTFKDFAPEKRPFVIINSTNIGMETPFEFTQEQFDLLGSDLDAYPIARAVAASSAFPGLLSPLTLENFDLKIRKKPDWVKHIQDDWTYELGGANLNEAWDWNAYQNKRRHPWIHLLDGGLTDNLGLRAIGRLFDDPNDPGARWRLEGVNRIIIISVDSARDFDKGLDLSRKTPGLVSSMACTVGVPMDSYTDEASEEVVDLKRELESRRNIKLEFVVVTPLAIADPAAREKMLDLPTSFHLAPDQVDLDVRWGRKLLLDNSAFKRAVAEMR